MLICASQTQAQILPGGIYPEHSIASYTYHSCSPGVPCDDIVINSDMVEDPNGVIKAIAWSSDHTGNTKLYVEDYNGNTATVDINGYIAPDIVIASSTTALSPNTSGYQVLLVYWDGTDVFFDAYNLFNVGLTSFNLVSAIATLTPPNIQTPSPINKSSCVSFPHIDMWADRSTYSMGIMELHEFVATWTDASGNIQVLHDDISSGFTAFPSSIGISGDMPDVAAYFDQPGCNGLPPDQHYAIVYNSGGQIQLYEFTFSGLSGSITIDATTDSYVPRIEAQSIWNGWETKWQIAANVPASGGIKAVNGYNDLTTGPTNMSSLLAPLYPSPPHNPYAAMGACVAASTYFTPLTGTKQYIVGFYPWQTDSLYARGVSTDGGFPGTLTTPTQCHLVNNSDVDYNWDYNVGYALSSSSNSGKHLLAAWYNGSDIVYKFSPSNTLVFRPSSSSLEQQTDVKNLLISTDIQQTLKFRSEPGSLFTICDVTGKTVATGHTVNTVEAVDVSGLAAGTYILRVTNMEYHTTEHAKFIKP